MKKRKFLHYRNTALILLVSFVVMYISISQISILEKGEEPSFLLSVSIFFSVPAFFFSGVKIFMIYFVTSERDYGYERIRSFFFPLLVHLSKLSKTSDADIKKFLQKYYGGRRYKKNLILFYTYHKQAKQRIDWGKLKEFLDDSGSRVRTHALYELIEFSIIDGVYTAKEDEFIRKFASKMNIHSRTVTKVKAMFFIKTDESTARPNPNQGTNSQGRKQESKDYSYNYYSKTVNQNVKTSFYCTVLNISSDATEAEIKKSYYKLAKKFHPDRVRSKNERDIQHATEMFQKISEAYTQILAHKKVVSH